MSSCWPSDEGGLGFCGWPPWGPSCQQLSSWFARLSVRWLSPGTPRCTCRSSASVVEVAPWMFGARFPLSSWLWLCCRRDPLNLLRWRFCYRLVFELFAPVDDLHGFVQKHSHQDFVFRPGTSAVVLYNLVEAVVVPDGPIVLYGTGLFPAEHFGQIELFGQTTVEVRATSRPTLKPGVQSL